MDERLFEALEVCLNALETGVDLESALKLYPDIAEELRPVLEASAQARSLALLAVPEAVVRRGRVRILQHAAGMRKAIPKARRRWSIFGLPRLAASLVITLVLLLSGTGLVSASNGALPGDQLYSVKRSWEDLRLFFAFSPAGREGLESEFEQERVDEISKLLTEGRKEPIAFAGLVTSQSNEEWNVSGITVMITSNSRLPVDPVSIGAPVMVIGHTNAQGFVQVDTLETLGPGTSLPPLKPSHAKSIDLEESTDQGNEAEGNSTLFPQPLENTTYDFQGIVESMNGNLWMINGQQVNVGLAENVSQISVGMLVEFRGYYSADGQFMVTKLETKSSGLLKKDQLNSSKNQDNVKNDNTGKSDGSGSGEDGGSGGNNSNDEDGHNDN